MPEKVDPLVKAKARVAALEKEKERKAAIKTHRDALDKLKRPAKAKAK